MIFGLPQGSKESTCRSMVAFCSSHIDSCCVCFGVPSTCWFRRWSKLFTCRQLSPSLFKHLVVQLCGFPIYARTTYIYHYISDKGSNSYLHAPIMDDEHSPARDQCNYSLFETSSRLSCARETAFANQSRNAFSSNGICIHNILDMEPGFISHYIQLWLRFQREENQFSKVQLCLPDGAAACMQYNLCRYEHNSFCDEWR